MGWNKCETTIERLRNQVRRQPEATADEIRRELRTGPAPTYRGRLLGLLSATYRERALYEEAAAIIETAQNIAQPGPGAPGPLAISEVAYHRAVLRLAVSLQTRKGWAATVADASEALRLAYAVPEAADPKTSWGKRRARERARRIAFAHVNRGQVFLYAYSDTSEAIRHACEALRWADKAAKRPPGKATRRPDHYTHRAHLAAASLLVACAVRDAPAAELCDAARILDRIILVLPDADEIGRAQMAGAYAVLAARLGRHDEAEEHLLYALDRLREIGAANAYHQLLDLLEWVVEDVTRRAQLAAQLAATAPPDEAAPPDVPPGGEAPADVGS